MDLFILWANLNCNRTRMTRIGRIFTDIFKIFYSRFIRVNPLKSDLIRVLLLLVFLVLVPALPNLAL